MNEVSFVKQLRDNAVFIVKQEYSELKPDDDQDTWEKLGILSKTWGTGKQLMVITMK